MLNFSRLVCCVLVVAGCATPFSTPADSQTATEHTLLITLDVPLFRDSSRTYRSGHWTVPLHTRTQLRKLTERYGLRLVEAWPIEALNLYCAKLIAPPATNMSKLLNQLSNEPVVALAQPNQKFIGMTAEVETGHAQYNDPLVDVQYGNHATMIRQLHNASRGDDVRIGVIDGNVDVDHADLQGQIARNYRLVKTNGAQGLLHGTAVAGIIGAAAGNGEGVAGLAPNADIFVYGACGDGRQGTECTSFSLAKALAHAIDDNVAVLNLSIAGPQDLLLMALLEKVIAQQTIVVAAVNSSDHERNFPANFAGVHAATAQSLLWFARGEQITTQAGGGYRVFTGSSIAAAGMSGAATLLRSHYSPAQTNKILTALTNNDCKFDAASAAIPSLLVADGCP